MLRAKGREQEGRQVSPIGCTADVCFSFNPFQPSKSTSSPRGDLAILDRSLQIQNQSLP